MTGRRVLLLLAVAGAIGCGAGSEPPEPAAPVAWNSALGTATITVRAIHEGAPVKMRPLKMEAEETCASQYENPVLQPSVVKSPAGELANVVAWISKGTGGFAFEVPPAGGPATMEMVRCMFEPHVLSVDAGRPVRFVNPDHHRHHLHLLPKANSEVQAKVAKREEVSVTYRVPEIGIKVKDDVHSWMEAWISVFDHPFHGVTGADGKIALPKVPAGTYTVSVWHEYGKFTTPDARSVTVKDGETVEMTFTFRDR